MSARFPVAYLFLLLLAVTSLFGQQQQQGYTWSSPSGSSYATNNGQCRATAGAAGGVAEAATESLRKPPSHTNGIHSSRGAPAGNKTEASFPSSRGSAVADSCNCEPPASEPPLPIRVAFLVVVHNERTMSDAVPLVRAIRHPHHHVLVHVDAKARASMANSTLGAELEACGRCFASARMESVYDVKWSHWSMNLPTLWGMERLLQAGDDWDVFINLSGDTMPVYRPAPLAERLRRFRYNFVTSSSCETGLRPTSVYEFPTFWHKRAHYTNRGEEPDPAIVHSPSPSARARSASAGAESADEEQTLEPGQQSTTTTTVITHFGSQWMILQRDFVVWLVAELDRPQSLPSLYRDYLVESGKLMTDETYIPSLIVSQFPHTLPRADERGFLLPSDPGDSEPSSAAPGAAASSAEFENITDVRYERMDEHVPTAFGELWSDQRLMVPPNSTLVEQERPWGPYYLCLYDLGSVRESGAWFVRKVSSSMDDNLQRLLPVDRRSDVPQVFWPRHEIALRAKPDWAQRLAEWKVRAADRQRLREEAAAEGIKRSLDEAEDEEL